MSKTIHQEIVFEVPPDEVYAALMETKRHTAFTKNGPAKISQKVGGAFSAHGGYVSGINLELIPGKRIVQAWRAKSWPEGIYSIVHFALSKRGKGTALVFDHTAAPPEQVESLTKGWHDMYWSKMTDYFNSEKYKG